MVLKVAFLSTGTSAVLENPIEACNIFQGIPPYQPNDDGDAASLYQFPNTFDAVSTDKSHFVELSAFSLQRHSRSNLTKVCRQFFSTTIDETLLSLPSFYYKKNDIPVPRNCKVESVVLQDAPRDFCSADGIYRIISRDRNI